MKANAEDRVALMARSLATEVATGPGLMMYMPGGVHSITCGLGDASYAEVTIKVDRETAARLNKSLAELNAAFAPQKALFDANHEGKEAMAWPLEFLWKDSPKPGVYAKAEYSSLGREYIQGKVMRAFSGSFFTDANLPKRGKIMAGKTYAPGEGDKGSAENPALITGLDFPYAGTFTNNPAFHEILPLWAKEASGQRSQDKESEHILDDKGKHMAEKKELQARIQGLEKDIVGLKAQLALDPANATLAQELEEKETELKASQSEVENERLQAENAAVKAELLEQRGKEADAMIKAAIKCGQLPAQDEKLQASWRQKLVEDPSNAVLLAAIPKHPALQRERITISGVKIVRENSDDVLMAFAQAKHPLDRAPIYAEIKRRLKEGDPLPLKANTLGTLAGTLVTQRTLELLKLQFPILSSITTDFSDQQSKLNQTIESRIISIPSVVDYNSTTGWADSAVVSTDVPVVLNKQQGVQVTFTADVLSSTVRRLFDEFGEAQAYALAKSMVDGLYALFIAANYTNTASTYAQVDFGRPALIDVGVTLDGRGVPDGPKNRHCLLNAAYFGQLKRDPAIVTLAAYQDKEIIEQGVLPDVEGFRVIKAVNMPTTANLVGFAGSKSSACIAARLDADYTTILPGASYGNVTTVTDPDLGLSVLQVQYVNHILATASQRISLIWGVAAGQNNAGQLIKSA